MRKRSCVLSINKFTKIYSSDLGDQRHFISYMRYIKFVVQYIFNLLLLLADPFCTPVCTSSSQCNGTNCSSTHGRCVCDFDSHCPSGMLCEGGFCEEYCPSIYIFDKIFYKMNKKVEQSRNKFPQIQQLQHGTIMQNC